MFSKLKIPLLSLALAAVLAPASLADGFGIGFTKKVKHGKLNFYYSTAPAWGPGPSMGYATRCSPAFWVPGHYETVVRPVWVEGAAQTVWTPPRTEWRYDACGRSYPVCVSSGHYTILPGPGHYETRNFQVWIDGRFQY